jgi:hypothetical protein
MSIALSSPLHSIFSPTTTQSPLHSLSPLAPTELSLNENQTITKTASHSKQSQSPDNDPTFPDILIHHKRKRNKGPLTPRRTCKRVFIPDEDWEVYDQQLHEADEWIQHWEAQLSNPDTQSSAEEYLSTLVDSPLLVDIPWPQAKKIKK